MAPRWDSLRFNLEFARSRVPGTIGDAEGGWVAELARGIYRYPTTRELVVVTTLLFWLAAACVSWMLWIGLPLSAGFAALFVLLDEPRKALVPSALIPLLAGLVVFGGWSAGRA